jgi:hypothetical protein
VKRKLTNTEIVLALLLVANLLFSIWLYRITADQSARIKTLERDDAVKQQVQKLNDKYDNLKDRIQGLFH